MVSTRVSIGSQTSWKMQIANPTFAPSTLSCYINISIQKKNKQTKMKGIKINNNRMLNWTTRNHDSCKKKQRQQQESENEKARKGKLLSPLINHKKKVSFANERASNSYCRVHWHRRLLLAEAELRKGKKQQQKTDHSRASKVYVWLRGSGEEFDRRWLFWE